MNEIASLNPHNSKVLISNLTFGSSVLMLLINLITSIHSNLNYLFFICLAFIFYFTIFFSYCRIRKIDENSLFSGLIYGVETLFIAIVLTRLFLDNNLLLLSVYYNSLVIYILIFFSPYLIRKINTLTFGCIWIAFLILIFFYVDKSVRYPDFLVLIITTIIVVASVYKFVNVITDQINFQNAYTKDIEAHKSELLSINEYNNKLISIISHDLRSPVLTIQQLLGSMEKEPESISIDDIIALECLSSDVITLIENLLLWSRQHNNNFTFNNNSWDIYPIVNKTIALYSANAKLKNIEVINNIPEFAKAYFDYQSISLIIRNLINNAIKFTYRTGKIEISSKTINDTLIIFIQDNGIGIDENRLSILNSGDNNTSSLGTEKELGTGLGVNLCKKLIALNNGSIKFESKLNIGTKVIIALPIKETTT